MMNKYSIISGDSHLDLLWLPFDTFQSRSPANLKERMLRVVDTPTGKRWKAGDMDIAPVAGVGSDGGKGLEPVKGIHKQVDRIIETGLYADGKKGIFRPTDPVLRRKDQERDGIDAEVMYGILGVLDRLDADIRAVSLRIYNDWASEFCKTNPDRFAGLALIPNNDPQLAAAEVRRAAKLGGLRGCEMSFNAAVKPVYHRDWDPLWAAAAECSMPVAFHTRGLPVRQPAPEDFETYKFLLMSFGANMAEFAGIEFLNSIVMSGACDRHRGLRFVLGECGAGWLPHALDRMDHHYEMRFFPLKLSAKPSEIWRRQGYTTFQDEPVMARVIDLIGEDNVMWGSDYPHHNGVWPGAQEAIKRSVGSLPQHIQRKITCENAGKLYGFIKSTSNEPVTARK